MPDARRGPAKKPTAKKVAAKKPPAQRSSPARRRNGIVGLVLGAVVLVGLLFAFVYPTRTFLDQRNDTSRARAQLGVLQTENAKLASEAKRLQDPAEIEKLAREYGLVKPNEQRFVIVPAPTVPATTTPAATPPAGAGGDATPSP